MHSQPPENAAHGFRKSFIRNYQTKLLSWFHKNKRCFPWRETQNPYYILISEILLQKTNSRAVGEVYQKIIEKYPTPLHVNRSSKEEIFDIISPLGLNYRAERILQICNSIVTDHGGEIPDTAKDLMALKGIGRYAASAVMCFGFDKNEAILDQNVIRILSRVFSIKSEKPRPHNDRNLWLAARYLVPKRKFREYNYALLDFSALICKPKPLCQDCPLKDFCFYYLASEKGVKELRKR